MNEFVINVVPDPSTVIDISSLDQAVSLDISQNQPNSISIEDDVNNVLLNPSVFYNGINIVYLSGVSGELLHNTFGDLQGGTTGQYYHLTSGQYFNLTTGSVVRPNETGNFLNVGAITGDRGSITITGSSPSNLVFSLDDSTVTTSKILNGAVTNAKIGTSAITNSKIQDFAISSDKISGSAIITSLIANNAVTNAKLNDMAPNTIKGRISSGTGDPEDLTPDNVKTILNFDSSVSGLLSGYVTGDVVRPSETGNFITSSQTGQFYAASNPSGFIPTQEADIRFVNVTGNESVSGQKRFFDNIFFESGIDISGFVNFNLNQQISPLEGQMSWHPDYGTVQIGMNGGDVINPVGFKNFYRVKASEAIRKGKVVMAAGSVGNSEFILAKEAHGIGPSGELIMGIASEDISQNGFGDVVAFGAIKGVNTSSYPLDSILYYDPLITGGLTAQIPEAPNAKVIVGFNATQSNNGIIFVRVTAGSQLGTTDSNVKFTTLNDKDILFYDLNSGIWINRQINTGDISGISNFVAKSETGVFYPSSNPSGFITGVDLSSYATINYTTGISGDLQNQVTTLSNNTGSYYLNSNPSGFAATGVSNNFTEIQYISGERIVVTDGTVHNIISLSQASYDALSPNYASTTLYIIT